MRLLFLTPSLPAPPDAGARIRNYHLLRAAAAVYPCDLLSFVDGPVDEAARAELARWCGSVTVVRAPRRGRLARARDLLLRRDPDMAFRLASRAFDHALRTRLATVSYDLVQVEGLELGRYLLRHVSESRARPAAQAQETRADTAVPRPRPRWLYDAHNAEWLLQQRAFLTDIRSPRRWPGAAWSLAQWLRLRRFERALVAASDRTLAVSEADAMAIAALGVPTPIAVVPNGVDVDHFAFVPRPPEPSPRLIFGGTLDFRPNVDAALWLLDTILPLVRQQVPEATLTLVGRSPAPAILKRAADLPGVEVTGAVPDTRPYLARAAVYLLPIRMGSGTKLKALEAMAAGVPCVSTTLGVEGLGVTHGHEVAIADTAAGLARWTVTLLRDPALARRLATAARAHVETHFAWERITPRYLEQIELAVRGKGEG